MGHEEFSPDLVRLPCFPGNNASCVIPQNRFWTSVGLFLVFSVETLVTILGNFVVILSVCHFQQHHSPTNVLISSLALADFLVGVIILPIRAIKTVYGCWYYGDIYCELYITFDLFFSTASIFHLICISVDRQQAICNPLHYSRKITMSVGMIMTAVSWGLAALYSFGIIYSKLISAGVEDFMASVDCLGMCYIPTNPLWGILDAVFYFFFTCTVMVCLYTQIFIVAKQHVRKIGNQNICANDKRKGVSIKQSEHKAAKTLSIVLGAFIICWMPFFLTSIIDPLIDYNTPFAVHEGFIWLGYLNSALNPIIYALFFPSFRKCFHLIITLKIFSPNSSNMNLSLK